MWSVSKHICLLHCQILSSASVLQSGKFASSLSETIEEPEKCCVLHAWFFCIVHVGFKPIMAQFYFFLYPIFLCCFYYFVKYFCCCFCFLFPSPCFHSHPIPCIFLYFALKDIDQLKLILMLVGTPEPELLMKISSDSVSFLFCMSLIPSVWQ